MKKLLKGIVEFRKNVRPDYKDVFAKLALGQAPDTLFIACSDSRVVPNLFASADPGDLFVIRNVGNLIPSADEGGKSTGDEAQAAAVEFVLWKLPVTDIIVCGHSECGAMQALLGDRKNVEPAHLKSWLRHGEEALAKFKQKKVLDPSLAPHNQLSQLNVLDQIEHLKSYPLVRERMKAGRLRLHGWWFELKGADVYAYEEAQNKFVLIDEKEADRLLKRFFSPA